MAQFDQDQRGNVPRKYYDGELAPYEEFWRDLSPWLEERGYKLRPRYQLGWKPSWAGTDNFLDDCEDGVIPRVHGSFVVFKPVSTKDHPHEVEIGRMLSAEPLASDPRNHCVPIYDVLQLPDNAEKVLLVMPLLRPYNRPPFQTVGEAVEYFRQVFEGRPLYPKLYHPQQIDYSLDVQTLAPYHTRTARPTRYYFIDFGLSRRYESKDGHPREYPIWGGDKTVPEFHRSNDACDPFPTDIYYLGNMIREDFLQVYHGLHFMQDLVGEMVHDDPIRRPTAAQVVTRFDVLYPTLSFWTLRSRLVRRDESWLGRVFRGIWHIFRTAGHVLARRPAVPTP
ncbi:hypothetical protein IEO21_09627 [Rhodonia placenta]|uniref:Protein kinase domain-containing protein n=1 Tax=Rhodonia placenta TaxID=104341 RepID=A0A8H7NU42_9APHY|nr:hypothetical protein IEO21_09627 [Postia placenta]